MKDYMKYDGNGQRKPQPRCPGNTYGEFCSQSGQDRCQNIDPYIGDDDIKNRIRTNPEVPQICYIYHPYSVPDAFLHKGY